jgi:hypothetical protein
LNRRRGHRPGLHDRTLLLLFAFLQQLENVARLGNLGKIELRFDLGGTCFFPHGRRGLRRKMPANLLGFVVLNGA